MKFPPGVLLQIKKVQTKTFTGKVPFRGIWFHTFLEKEIEFEDGWVDQLDILMTLKFFCDSEGMKKNMKEHAYANRITVETLTDISTRLDQVEQQLQNLSTVAITKASDFVEKADTFWHSDQKEDWIPLEIPSGASIRFYSSYSAVADDDLDLVITQKRTGSYNYWQIHSPLMETFRLEDRIVSSSKFNLDHYVSTTGSLKMMQSLLHVDASVRPHRETNVFSYQDPEDSTHYIPWEFPVGSHAIFNNVLISKGSTLYLDDPEKAIQRRKQTKQEE